MRNAICVINSEMLKDEWIFVRKNLDSIIEKAQKVYRSRTEGKNNFANLWCCDFKKLETLLCEWVQECKRNDSGYFERVKFIVVFL